ncbi:MAG: hypothetical protein Q4C96_06020 [Planctomycetia bacterium]|nr:hypothetical protein [Planctomycetia bacterium]
MKRTTSWFIVFATILATLLGSGVNVQAEKPKPVVTISFAGYNAFINNLKTIGELADYPSLSSMVEFPLQLAMSDILKEMDKNAPIGAVLMQEEVEDADIPEYNFLFFLPITSAEPIFDFLSAQSVDLDITQQENGVITVNAGGPDLFLKSEGKFLYLATAESLLKDLPKDATVLLDNLHTKYNIFAVKIHMDNLSSETKQWAFDTILEGIELVEDDEANSLSALTKQNNREMLKLWKEYADSITTLTYGMLLDKETCQLKMEGLVQTAEGSVLENIFQNAKKHPSQFSGFSKLDATITSYSSSVMNNKTRETSTTSLNSTLQIIELSILEEIKKAPNIDKGKYTALTELFVKNMKNLCADLLAQEVLDSAAIYDLSMGNFMVLSIGTSKNPESLTKLFKDLSDTLAKEKIINESDIQTNFEKWNDFTFSKLSIPLDVLTKLESFDAEVNSEDMENLKKLFGEEITLTVGTSKDKIMIGMGENVIPTLKKGLQEKSETTFQSHVKLSSLSALNFGKQLVYEFAPEDDESLPKIKYALQMIEEILESEKDENHIQIQCFSPESNTFKGEFIMEKGLVKLLGSIPNIVMMLQLASEEDLEEFK